MQGKPRKDSNMRTKKVLELNDNGIIIECVKDYTQAYNPYRVYRKWWDGGWHRKQMERYSNIESVLCWAADEMRLAK